MRTLRFILQKEFLQIFRNRAMLPIIFVMPIVQLIILGNAATFEIRQIEVVVVDQDRSPTSRLLISKLEASGYFVRVAAPVHGPAEDALLDNSADIVIRIPRFFERDLQRLESADLQLVLDAQDAATSGVAFSYASSIIASLGRQIAIDRQTVQVGVARQEQIRIVPASWYNPELSYTTYMVPGILVLLVTMIGAFLSAMNVVREKEIGTIVNSTSHRFENISSSSASCCRFSLLPCSSSPSDSWLQGCSSTSRYSVVCR